MTLLTVTGSHIALQAPYHPELSAQARRLGGRFRGKEAGWLFDADQENALRGLCHTLWGVDGTAGALIDTVTLRVTVRPKFHEATLWRTFGSDIWMCGRQIASRRPGGRPVVVPGRGVKFTVGRPRIEDGPTGSFMLLVDDGCVFTVRDMPRMALTAVSRTLADIAEWEVT
ncbi:hypothetical protein AA23498_2101 [Acetobacter nitrogenifigens DSM 23921 = NBRC 105050]|uniref:hypothetical protein n=1 Tax=Acetobacter nitrogenifigens TaxID=285268 RepID=UPI0003FB71EE|nr:hypothetical protein [Acetobacter nitrogenifigens]GBQ94727.1 hypothetical protein AA23498_2101 [Acetobacter nitrogenifigens DSM 23921 = NBRC 105050]